MASNPHSDFTTHKRTLPTLSNLPIFATHAEFRLLSHVVASVLQTCAAFSFSHVFASIYFRLSFLLYYLDNRVCYLVLQSLDQLVVAPLLNSLIPPFPSPPESTPSA